MWNLASSACNSNNGTSILFLVTYKYAGKVLYVYFPFHHKEFLNKSSDLTKLVILTAPLRSF